MAKRITISVRDKDYNKLKIIADSQGKKVIDLINKKLKGKSNIGKILKMNEDILYENSSIKHSLNQLKEQVNFLQKMIFEVAKLNTEYSAFSKTIMTEIMKNIMKNRSKEEIDEALNGYLKFAKEESTGEIKKILIM